MKSKYISGTVLAGLCLVATSHSAFAKPTVAKVTQQLRQFEKLRLRLAKDASNLSILDRAKVIEKFQGRSFLDQNGNRIPDGVEDNGCRAGAEVEAKGTITSIASNTDGTIQFSITTDHQFDSSSDDQTPGISLTFVTTAQTTYRSPLTGPGDLVAGGCVEAKGYSAEAVTSTSVISLSSIKSEDSCGSSSGGSDDDGSDSNDDSGHHGGLNHG